MRVLKLMESLGTRLFNPNATAFLPVPTFLPFVVLLDGFREAVAAVEDAYIAADTERVLGTAVGSNALEEDGVDRLASGEMRNCRSECVRVSEAFRTATHAFFKSSVPNAIH